MDFALESQLLDVNAQDLFCNNEEVGWHQVTLSQPAVGVKVTMRDSVDKHWSFHGADTLFDQSNPLNRKIKERESFE